MRTVELPLPILTVRGSFGAGIADLVAERLAALARHAHEPVLAIRVALSRRTDPADPRPVAVRANVDFNGRQVPAAATGRTAREAVDLAVDRLIRQMDDRPHVRRRPAHRST